MTTTWQVWRRPAGSADPWQPLGEPHRSRTAALIAACEQELVVGGEGYEFNVLPPGEHPSAGPWEYRHRQMRPLR